MNVQLETIYGSEIISIITYLLLAQRESHQEANITTEILVFLFIYKGMVLAKVVKSNFFLLFLFLENVQNPFCIKTFL